MCLTAGASQAQSNDEEAVAETAPLASLSTWPHSSIQGDLTFTVYPPQLDRWQGDRLEGGQPLPCSRPVRKSLCSGPSR